jgi:hypothetical protein
MPAIVGFILGTGALAGLLVGALTSGFMLAVMMSNSGGAWDNAKKYVEKDLLGEGMGKGTSYHDAVVVGDTVGDPFKDTSGPALNILIKLMSIISLVLAPVFFLLYGQQVRPFRGDATGTIEAWVAPLIGAILLVAVIIICAIFTCVNNKAMEAFKADVEQQYEQANSDIGEDGQIEMVSLRKDSAFAIETHISFKSKEGAEEYAEAFADMAETRKKYASSYLLTKVRESDEGHHQYVEFIVFRSSAAFRSHRMDQGEFTDALKQAMTQHVHLDEVVINVLGSVDETEKSVLSQMGATIYEDVGGYINHGEAEGEAPLIITSTFSAKDSTSVSKYVEAFSITAKDMESSASTYLLTANPLDPNGLSFNEVMIFRSAETFAQHSQIAPVKEQLGPALEKFIDSESVRVNSIGQESGNADVDAVFTHVNASFADHVAGYKSA